MFVITGTDFQPGCYCLGGLESRRLDFHCSPIFSFILQLLSIPNYLVVLVVAVIILSGHIPTQEL